MCTNKTRIHKLKTKSDLIFSPDDVTQGHLQTHASDPGGFTVYRDLLGTQKHVTALLLHAKVTQDSQLGRQKRVRQRDTDRCCTGGGGGVFGDQPKEAERTSRTESVTHDSVKEDHYWSQIMSYCIDLCFCFLRLT